MNWIEFKSRCNIYVGYEIEKFSGIVCPIGYVNDNDQFFRYIINGNAEKPIYFKWVLNCISVLNSNKYISNKQIRSFCKADCDTHIVSSLIVKGLKLGTFDVPSGRKMPIGIIKT
jgi:hypothetical protein